MVPRRDVRHDVVQLEGDLQNVRNCLEKVLQLCETKPPPTTLTLAQLPSQTKLRNVSRKTETTIRKKKADNSDNGEMWQLSISGATAEHIASAVQMLERWQEEQQPGTGESPPRRNNNANGGGNNAGRGRGRNHRNNNNKGGKNNSKNKQAAPAAAESSTPPTN
jgi:hypothetical protein